MLSPKQVLAGIALMIALALIGAKIRSYDPIRTELMEWPSSTNLAMQFVHNSIDAQMVAGPDGRYESSVAAQQYWDFGFIAAYIALFTLFALGMRKSEFELIRWLGWALAGAALATGLCDIAENVAILRTLKRPDSAGWIRDFSMPKWILASLMIFLPSLLFMFWPRVPGWLRGIGILTGVVFMMAGLHTLIAISDVALNLYAKIENGDAWIAAALIGAAVFWICELARAALAQRGSRAIPARAR